jgi:signal peptidase I
MLLPSSLRSPEARVRALKTGGGRLVWSLLLPLAIALLALRTLVPSRMQGGPGGFWAICARFADEHPLILGIVLFLAVGETLSYWRGRRPAAAHVTLDGTRLDRRRLTGLGLAIVVAIAAAALLRGSVAQINRVISVSMLPTLVVGDRLIVDKLAYGLKLPLSSHRIGAKLPRRGDVIVFPGTEDESSPKTMVKRVIGLPGDYIAFQLGHVIVNNWVVPSCDAGPFAAVMGRLTVRGRLAVEFLDDRAYLTVTTPGGASFSGYRVLPGEVFVIGDDRGISSDSRVWNAGRGGGVHLESIEGRVTRILAGGRQDGRIDVRHLLSPLGIEVREPNVDLHKSEAFIAACLQNPPASTRPPASGM